MPRRALVIVLVLALAAGGDASARVGKRAAAPATAAFFVSGHGWGHGVGMSQYGALGFATHGWGYARILAHYFRGTQLGKAPIARVRVLLRAGAKSATVSSTTPFRVRDGAGELHQLDARAYAFGPGLRLKLDPSKPLQQLPAPLLFSAGSAPLALDGKLYRGQLQAIVTNGKLQIVNPVALEAYLNGVVPREMPFDWHPEALKAQAVVARSYALAVRKTGAFDLYPDTRSQVYGGIAAEKPETNAAVAATVGQIVTFEGKLATTYFFSTSGGRTATVTDVWPDALPTPYLVSVPDPYDSISPHHSWGPYAFTARRLAKAFKVPGRLVDVQTVLNASRRVLALVATGTNGEVSVAGADVRRILGLRSTWFRVGVLALDAPPASVTYGSAVRLTGRARAVANVTLEQRASSRVWEPASKVKPAADGTLSVAVKPLVTTAYRLSAGAGIASGPVQVAVAPRVRFAPVEVRTELRGTVRPLLPGVGVDVQRLSGTAWKTVAHGSITTGGAFAVQLELVPGSYRARVAPGRGFVPGVSPVLKVIAG